MDKKHTNNEYVHDYFLHYMKEHGYTKDKFAELLEVKPYNVYTSFPAEDSEKPPRNFSLDEIVTFCIKTGTSLDDILELDARRSSDEKKPETFRDILAMLFKLEDDPHCNTSITDRDGDTIDITFQFHLGELKEQFKAWQALKTIKNNGVLIKAFRESALNIADSALKKDRYLTRDDITLKVIETLIDEYGYAVDKAYTDDGDDYYEKTYINMSITKEHFDTLELEYSVLEQKPEILTFFKMVRTLYELGQLKFEEDEELPDWFNDEELPFE